MRIGILCRAYAKGSRFEGPNREGENFYQVLVYYRGMGDRNGRLVGFLPVNYYDE